MNKFTRLNKRSTEETHPGLYISAKYIGGSGFPSIEHISETRIDGRGAPLGEFLSANYIDGKAERYCSAAKFSLLGGTHSSPRSEEGIERKGNTAVLRKYPDGSYSILWTFCIVLGIVIDGTGATGASGTVQLASKVIELDGLVMLVCVE